jgi:hypothetical protein
MLRGRFRASCNGIALPAKSSIAINPGGKSALKTKSKSIYFSGTTTNKF